MMIYENLENLKVLKEMHRQNVTADSYMLGLYNGLELSIAIMEGRAPEFMDPLDIVDSVVGTLQ